GMASVVVTEDMAPPSASAAANGLLTCADPTITLDGAGSTTGAGFNYQWTTPDGHIVSGGTSLNPLVDQPGTYTLTVTNTANGCTANASVTVSEDTTVPTAAATGGVLDCSNTQIGL
ncbi:MAG: hypothetical protein KDC32_26680, partial [Saprospiraceae bacterium]|nr:hypothetical protein [Saprospiraceae bacterium]